MKILQVNDTYSLIGGSEKTLLKCSDYLTRLGHEVIIAHADRSAQTDVSAPWRQVYVEALDGVTPLGPQRQAYQALLTIAESENVDVIHSRNFNGFGALRKLSRLFPVVRTVHTIWGYCPNGAKYSPKFDRVCLKRCGWACLPRSVTFGCRTHSDAKRIPMREWILRIVSCKVAAAVDAGLAGVVVTSEYMKSELMACGVPGHKVTVIPPPIEAPDVPEPDASAIERNVLFTGRLVLLKGVGKLLDAMALLPEDVRLDVLGDGPARRLIEDHARTAGVSDRVVFHGWTDHEHIGELMARAGVVAFTSTGLEAFGNVGPEAFVRFRPVVAFDVGGVSEWLVDGENGWLVPAGDVRQLARRIRECLDDPERSIAMGKAGRGLVERRFTAEMHARRTLDLYEQCIERHRKTS